VIGGRFNDGDLTRTFRDWADSLKAAGIYRIEGDIVGDDNVFDDVPLGYSWAWDDEPFWYSAEISGLSFNDNCVDFSLVAARENQPAHLTWEPAMTTYIDAENASVTGPADSRIREGYSRTREGNAFRFWSRVPEGRTDYESLSVHNPTLLFVHVLRETLLAEGISVGGSPRDVDELTFLPDYSAATRMAVHHSPPMAEIVTVINKRSQNLYAEQVLKTLGVLVNDSTGTSAADGVRASMKVFSAARMDTSRIQLVDGSGLSRLNLVTADMTTDLLQYMAHHPDTTLRSVFAASLPIAGVDGTIGSRMRDTPAAGNLIGKTGTLGAASALSGYVTNASGTLLTFSIMVNHFTGSSSGVRAIQDRLGAALARSVD
jgi:D-alanyl-D-alanine carboxypeptidase/D-alanyl-D-alanine-endopeptidase (penicillin-binding protein 4)